MGGATAGCCLQGAAQSRVCVRGFRALRDGLQIDTAAGIVPALPRAQRFSTREWHFAGAGRQEGPAMGPKSPN